MRPRLCPTFSVTALSLILSAVIVSGQKPEVSVQEDADQLRRSY